MPTRKLKKITQLQPTTQAELASPHRADHDFEAKLSALRNAIDEGDASGIFKGNPFSHIRSTIKSRHAHPHPLP